MRLYSNPVSSNALKVRFLLAELGLRHELVDVPLTAPRPDDYLALNPVGGVPTLEDDGFVLAESNTILRYLARRSGRDDLYPGEPRAQARVDELLDRFSLTFRPALFAIEMPALGFKMGAGFDAVPRDLVATRAREAESAPRLAILERLLPEAGYAVGAFSIADCALAPALYRTRNTGMDMTPYPRITRLREALIARPAFQAARPVL